MCCRHPEFLTANCVVQFIFSETVLHVLLVCKAEEGGVAVATPTDDNAADGKIGSAVLLIMSRTAQTLIFVLYKLSAYF